MLLRVHGLAFQTVRRIVQKETSSTTMRAAPPV
jgi:hypothetical protein